MNDVVIVQQSPEVQRRAEEVKEQLSKVRASLEDNFFSLCDLLRETHKNAYHHTWGFSNFESWVENSGLDLSPRQAYYYISIASKAEKLGLDRSDLAAAKISKLKEIFTLDPTEYAGEMKELVAAAATEGLQAISDRIKEIRKRDGKPTERTYSMKFSTEIKETQQKAFELARMNYGETIDQETGALREATDSQCMEIISVSYIQDVDNYPEGMTLADLADTEI
jgi:hypothetical protein